MTYRKTPDNLHALKREAETIRRALVARDQPNGPPTDTKAVVELIASAEAHLEEVRAGYYENELERTHLDLVAAYASLAKAGARAIAIRMDTLSSRGRE